MLAEALSRTGVKNFLQLDVDAKTLQILDFDKAKLKILLDDLFYGPRVASTKQRNTAEKSVKVHDTREPLNLCLSPFLREGISGTPRGQIIT